MHDDLDLDTDAASAGGKWPRLVLALPVLAGLLIFHFVAVGLYVCPPNPVSLRARPWLNAYIVPYLTQSWLLFAPEPSTSNEVMHVRCHLREAGVDRVTEWIDITAPWIHAHQRNRFGVASRMIRAQRPRFAQPQEFERRAIEHLDGDLARRAKQHLDQQAAETLARGKEHARRVASAACKRRYAALGVTITQVEARQVSTKVRPYGVKDTPGQAKGLVMTLPPMEYVEVEL